MSLPVELVVLLLAGVVGWLVIGKVPATLHTPLMSATNAVHGIVVIGGLLVVAGADDALTKVLLVVAIAFGTLNVVGGFLVTDRMLAMFRPRREREPASAPEGDREREHAR